MTDRNDNRPPSRRTFLGRVAATFGGLSALAAAPVIGLRRLATPSGRTAAPATVSVAELIHEYAEANDAYHVAGWAKADVAAALAARDLAGRRLAQALQAAGGDVRHEGAEVSGEYHHPGHWRVSQFWRAVPSRDFASLPDAAAVLVPTYCLERA